MKDVFIIGDNIFSPLGTTSDENFRRVAEGFTGVEERVDTTLSADPFFASLFKASQFPQQGKTPYTRFEALLVASIADALVGTGVDPSDDDTVLLISSTKGNISLLETAGHSSDEAVERISLPHAASVVASHFGFVNRPVIVSNACISGILAMVTAMRLLQSGRYRHAVVAGADLISRFVLSGFQSFQAISGGPCKPFDAARNGINLGEGAGTVVLSTEKIQGRQSPVVAGGAVTNDANHISGPSRTGRELYDAIARALREAGVSSREIDFISAHGTATMYNDEMESLAFNLAGLESVPVNSLKGYYGHTLGAAGIIETIISVKSMYASMTVPTKGFERSGVTRPINVCEQAYHVEMGTILKTASGFGGCNAALVVNK